MKSENVDIVAVWEVLMGDGVDPSAGMDRGQFQSLLDKLCSDRILSEEEIDALFNVLDKDQSGRISLDEAREWWQSKS